jgi:hypothetical protein
MTIDPVSLAITAALTAAQMALQASKKIEGPRLEDLSVTLADYGTPLPYIFGERRLEGVPIIWAEEITEKKRRRKTKGGKFNEYSYSGTWAVVVADHEIDAVLKIFFDKHLVYDATGAGPMSPLSSIAATLTDADEGDDTAPINLSEYIRVYLGTETQEPDPRMLATVEAEHGVGSCPAYRGIAYIVFEDVPLEKFGNRIPQIAVVATDSGTEVFPQETVDTDGSAPEDLDGFTFSTDYSRFLFGGQPEIWDTAARSLMVVGSGGLVGDLHGISRNGTIYSLRDTLLDPHVTIHSPDGLTSAGADIPLAEAAAFAQVISDGEGNEFCLVAPYGNIQDWIQYFPLQGLSSLEPVVIDPGFSPSMYLADNAGNIWAVGGPHGASNQVGFHCVVGDRAGENQLITAPTSHSGDAQAWAVHNGQGSFVVSHGNRLFLLDDETFAIGTTVTHTSDLDDLNRFAACRPGSGSIWLKYKEVSLTSLATLRTLDFSDWGTAFNDEGFIYDPVNHAIILARTGTSELTWLYLDRVGSDAVTLQTVVEATADRCGLDAGDIDASDLSGISIIGWSVTQGAGKDWIAGLLDLYDVDARPHNFQIQFLQRGNASSGTLDVDEFVRQGSEPRYKITIGQDTDIPRSATLSFADPAGDQQTNTAHVRRDMEATDGKRELSVDMTTLVLTADEARQLTERYFRRQWNARERYEFGLTAQRLAIEPADVWTLGLDDVSRTARNTKLTITGKENILRTEWERDAPILNSLTSTTGATFDGRRDQVILVPQISKGFVLDIPLISDAHNDTNPIIYYGAGPYSEGLWPGATVYRSADGIDYEEEFASVPSTVGLTWGYANGTLATATAAVWDRGNSVNVTVKNGELVSATEAACDADPSLNLCLLGDELLQFTTAALQGNGTYTLSGLKRGRRGTEWAVSGHASGEQFVMLDAVGNEELGASDIGDDLFFKAVTEGRGVESAFPIEVAYEANSHKPYAPAHVNAIKDPGTGDWTITWRRRSRIGSRWTGLSTVPLGESTEEYEVDLLDGPGGAVLHTYAPTSQSQTISSADQTTYAGGDIPLGDLDIQIRQIGDLVEGRNTVGAF